MPSTPPNSSTTVEAKVTSKGQVTLPRELRTRLGIQNGSRIRFSIPRTGPVQLERVPFDLEDLWRMADEGGKPERPMSFAEMDQAKSRRQW
ncbi:MAG TPA: AbrB/MazE/SpoVT family DNA-binding domain-containing protein [Acidobacteriaceae bacterium]|nr:AbrB/MazE/SpoVT family DNA-binding domain-containing protein [Acidobacteriaceae bacterium]